MPNPTESDAYAEVIADLKRKRDKIDETIQSLESLRSGGMATAGESSEQARPEAAELGESPFLGMSIAEATKKLLAARRKPLATPYILSALEDGGLVLTGENKSNTVGSVLNRRFRNVGDVVNVKRGTWGLKEWYPGRNFNKKGSGEPDESSDDGIDDDQASEQMSEEAALVALGLRPGDANETNEPGQL